jgi:hypothetical protein
MKDELKSLPEAGLENLTCPINPATKKSAL